MLTVGFKDSSPSIGSVELVQLKNKSLTSGRRLIGAIFAQGRSVEGVLDRDAGQVVDRVEFDLGR